MVWAGVSLHHKTNIIFIKGNLTAARYQSEVLDTEVIPLVRNHRGMQLLHDGALAHRTGATTAYLNANNVNIVNSPPPPKSPDLNIIENIWDEQNRHVRRLMGYFDHTESTESKNSLRVNSLPQNCVQHYVTPI